LIAFANQVAVAIENARLYRQAQALAATQERQKLARELHDSVSQALYGIALGARTADEIIRQAPETTKSLSEPIAYILDLVEAALAEMRALIFELRPESLEKEGLVVALQKHIAAVQTRYKIPISLNNPSEPVLPLSKKEACYRVAQEAIQNSIKHAQASHITVLLTEEDQRYCLQIIDDGRGFDALKEYPGHLGLKSMHERIERLEGELRIDSTPGSGTAISACFKASNS
jgi:signal transduction histidine kinase